MCNKNNISYIKNCYGCGVCATICPKKIISLALNMRGFYEPQVYDTASCTECGLCLSVCSFIDKELIINSERQIKAYAVWSNDKQVRYQCSSGGFSFELGRFLINQGYKNCLVRYNPTLNRAEHYVASTIAQLAEGIGSKYIQSYTLEGFTQLNCKDRFLVVGTPCQIDSIRRYIRKLKIEEHYVLMDFFCHGTPSMNLWNKYLENIKSKTGSISSVSWRNKSKGWYGSYVVRIKGVNSYMSSLVQGDLFFKFFLADVCLNKACYSDCKYKLKKSSADIRIGDLWGKKYRSQNEGVSAVLSFTPKGDELIKQMKEYCTIIEEPSSVVTDGQLAKKIKFPIVYKPIMHALMGNMNLKTIAWCFLKPYKFVLLPIRVYRKLKMKF